MAQLTLDGYLTKAQIHRQFGRHPRTLTKDVTKAVTTHDKELMSLCRLELKKSKTIVEGVELIEEDKRDQYKDDGENPQFYFLPEFIEAVEQRQRDSGPLKNDVIETPSVSSNKGHSPHADYNRSIPRRSTPKIKTKEPKEDGAFDPRSKLPPLPQDAVERASLLEALYLNVVTDLKEEKDQSRELFEVITSIPALQEQNNILLKGLQEKLGLAAGTAPDQPEPKPASELKFQEAVSVNAVQPTPHASPEPLPTNRAAPSPTKPQQPKEAAKKKPRTSGGKKKTSSSRKRKPKAEPKSPGQSPSSDSFWTKPRSWNPFSSKI